jgi:hypothetical protein
VAWNYGFPASMEAPRTRRPSGGGKPPALESLDGHCYVGNTKIAIMFASHEASATAMGCAGRLDELERWHLFGYK